MINVPSLWVSVGLVVTTVYLLALLYISIYGSRITVPTVSDYFVASGSLSSVIIFLTTVASAFSSFTFLGGVGIAYSLGIAGLVIVGGIVVTDMPIVIMLGEKIWKVSKTGKDYVTPSDLLCDRFDDSVGIRVIVAFIAVTFTFFYVTIQFTGMGLVLTVLTDGFITRRVAIVIIGLMLAAYIAIGGMRGVAYTDALQAVLLWAGMVVVVAWVLMNSPSNVFRQVAAEAERVTKLTMDPLYLYTAAAGFGLAIPTFPHIWQRYYSSRRHSAVWGMGFGDSFSAAVLLTIFPAIIGFAGIVTFPGLLEGNPDTVILKYILQMPGPALGVLMAAAVAAAMSTADTMILMMGSFVSRDILQVLIGSDIPEEHLSTYSKVISGLLALGALVVSLLDLGLLVQVAIDLAIPGYLLLVPPAIAAFWWPRANKHGVIAGLLAGLVVVTYYTYTGASIPLNMWIGAPGFVVTTVVMVAVSLMTPEPPEDRVQEFVYDLRDRAPERLEKGAASGSSTPADD